MNAQTENIVKQLSETEKKSAEENEYPIEDNAVETGTTATPASAASALTKIKGIGEKIAMQLKNSGNKQR
jgi:predicted flap endonuclease-1-like 5' DNA nuclease